MSLTKEKKVKRINKDNYEIARQQMIGTKYNKLTLKDLVKERYKGKHQQALFKCDCGNELILPITRVKEGQTKSCGCLFQDKKFQDSIRKTGLKNRKYEEVCTHCGKKSHYAKGLCRNCYARMKNTGTPKYSRKIN